MNISVESTGPISGARASLATLVARDALLPLADAIRSVTLRVPPLRGDSSVRQCVARVELHDGRAVACTRSIACTRSALSVADVVEAAVHAARRDVFRVLGRELPARRATPSVVTHERRAR